MGIYGFLLVFIGGGLGSAARHGVNLLAARLVGTNYPIATFAINVVGAFVMGVVVELLALKASLPQSTRLFLTTGIIGGFTTFSTYALEVALLYERGEPTSALIYALGSVAFGVAALFAGIGLISFLS
ncbi:fluoride efflux transporter CrcB [Cupriavidus oxalaticus]|uniref:Fluoride-specific ion channel FluC n=1 Tax=Cupriavidus oxalaticus TaxID=96344 RepID=A0A5P3VT89_9BURK|nr:fluoride efflux transporter CrcB [Cupriavidus oxalaticus]QEZ48763.1 fluoride efflux transporter CrcB [Cupriavidus oxalaticus]